jgi:hypothetical protein
MLLWQSQRAGQAPLALLGTMAGQEPSPDEIVFIDHPELIIYSSGLQSLMRRRALRPSTNEKGILLTRDIEAKVGFALF